MDRRVIGTLLEEHVELLPGRLKLVVDDQQVCELKLGAVVLGLQFDRTRELAEGALALVQLQVSFG